MMQKSILSLGFMLGLSASITLEAQELDEAKTLRPDNVGLPSGSGEGAVQVTQLKPMERLDFEGFYEKALQSSSQIKESEAMLVSSEARMDLARSPMFPKLGLEVIGGPSPTFRGNALGSTTDYGAWGLAFESKVELIQPLYTFGAIGKIKEAAELAHEAEQGRHKREEWLLRQNVAKLYYGYQLAFEFRELTRDLLGQLRNAREEGLKMRRNKSKGAPSLTDLERLNVYITELEARFDESQKFMDLARLGMSIELGVHGSEEPRWHRANLKRRESQLRDLPSYQSTSRNKRPEYVALQKEIEARDAYAEGEKARQYPALFAGARWTYGYSAVSQDQGSIYASDPFHQNSLRAGLGIRWDLFSAEQRAKSSMARAEAIKTRAKNEGLLKKLDAELEKNWLELRFLVSAANQREKSQKSARKVYLDMLGGFILGTSSAKDLIESLGGLAMAQKSYLETVFEEQQAWVRFESSVGETL